MITESQVLDALREVQDPELHKSLVELNMIRNIKIDEQAISLDVVLTIRGCPLKATIEEDVRKQLQALGFQEIDLHFGSMTDEERSALSAQLQQERQRQTAGGRKTSSHLMESGTEFIAIASGKGGVGKSTVTVNLGVALARLGKKVGIVDADIYGFSIPDMMGIEQRPTVIGDMVLPVKRLGVRVMSMAFFVEENAPVMWRGPMLGKMLVNFFDGVYWGDLDILLLDLPPGTGDVALDIHQMLPKSKEILVTTPHATAAFVAARAGAMALHTKHEILGVVENMSWYETRTGEREYPFGRGGGEKLAQELKTELLAQLPLGAPEQDLDDPDFAPAVYPADHPQAKYYDDLAKRMIEGI
ncbi:ATP-binding protein involved in chromosome partitioning [Seinonella peptonophila]|uniref:Iron-sulfur cluster carrier protein n=1 Tax=Seinonella peptonophila TaxID=112248 RepID=A0A1M4YY20_9BACL|nr:P-loop NTPase [Seinonella peptonophila]SHF10605.1 ATP-binding protein involved in chromosome partitioning [Seinonella peptonophila]